MKRTVLYLIMCFFAITSANSQVISIVGDGVNGWPPFANASDEIDLTNNGDGTYTIIGLTVNTGGVKFRQDHAWTINWGTNSFPTGTGTQDGANIPTIAGTYDVTFNIATGEYSFGGGAPIPVVKLVGTAVADPNGITFSTGDAETYTASNVTLLAGTGQFDIDGSLSGSTDFPSGAATDPLALIPIPAGEYSSITINISTGDFAFVTAPLIPGVAIVGDAVGGWPSDPQIDANQMTSIDGQNYTFTKLPVTVGGLKFRKDNAWTISWGGHDFPVGPAVGDTGDILVVAGQEGTYDVTFNRTSGAYAFSFPTIAIVGDGAGGWPSDPQVDANVMTTTDGVTYSKLGMTLTAGFAKFRQNNDWTVNWGGDVDPATFPTGNGVQGGTNIPTVAGIYDVTLNRVTGAYNFALLSTKGFSTSNFKVYPNPTANNWNFSSVKESIQTIQIVDVLGKTVMTVNPNNTAAIVDASALNAGIYFAKIATATANQTIKLMKN